MAASCQIGKNDGAKNDRDVILAKRLVVLDFPINCANADAEKLRRSPLVTFGELQRGLNYAPLDFIHRRPDWNPQALFFFLIVLKFLLDI